MTFHSIFFSENLVCSSHTLLLTSCLFLWSLEEIYFLANFFVHPLHLDMKAADFNSRYNFNLVEIIPFDSPIACLFAITNAVPKVSDLQTGQIVF